MRTTSAFIAMVLALLLIFSGVRTLRVGARPGRQMSEDARVPAAPGQTLLVDTGGSCDDTTGSPAYCSIQAAVDAAGNGDVIEVAAGTYTENVLIPSNSTLTINGAGQNSTIVDGADSERVFRIFSSSTVTLTNMGIFNGRFSLGGGIYSINADVHLEQMLLQENHATSSGGGLFAYNSEVTVSDSNVYLNTAGGDGGGIAIEGTGKLTLDGSVVWANAARRGGGIYAFETSVDVKDSNVVENTVIEHGGGIFRNKGYLGVFDSRIGENEATTGSGGGIATDDDAAANTAIELHNTYVYSNTAASNGGGIYLGDGTSKSLSIQDSEISYNTTNADGGGIDVEEGIVIISDSVLHGNTAADDGGAGYIYSADVNDTVQNSFIRSNEAGDDGGGFFADARADTKLDISRSVFFDNRAIGEGGALFSDRADLSESTVYSNTAEYGGGVFVENHFSGYNSTISGNSAQNYGGGILLEDGTLDLNAMTIVSNSADIGGGIYIDTNTTADVQKTLLANNTATSNDGPNCAADADDVTSLGYNLVGIGNGCGGNFLDGQNGDQVGSFGSPLAPGILPLTGNGGYTLPDGSVIPTHALSANSPAVDVIPTPTYCASDQTDQRGVTRVDQDGNGDGGGDGDGCDVGAFELEGQFTLHLPAVLR